MQTSTLVHRIRWHQHDACEGWLVRWARGLLFRLERQRQRVALGQLDDHLLADIGVSRKAADREAAKPLWRD